MATNWVKRKGIMLCYPFEQDRLEGSRRIAWNSWPVLTQPKLDGERCRAIINHSGDVTLLSSEENLILGVPHIVEALRALNLQNVEFDGELYRHGMHFSEIHSIVSRKVNLHNNHWLMQYHIFDVVGPGSQLARLVQVSRILDRPNETIEIVPTSHCNSFDEVICKYDEYTESGYEGIIVRHTEAEYVRRRTPYVLKFKPKEDDIYLIVGVAEEVSDEGVPKCRLGALICSGEEGGTFNVGTGFTEEARAVLWDLKDSLPGLYAHVEYQHLTTKSGVPRFPVFVSIWRGPENEVAADSDLLDDVGKRVYSPSDRE